MKYLTTDDARAGQALQRSAQRPVDQERAALARPRPRTDHFAVFLEIFGHPKSSASQVTAAGSTYEGVLNAFALRWQAGEVADLQAGLREVDRDIDTLLRRAAAGIKRQERPAA